MSETTYDNEAGPADTKRRRWNRWWCVLLLVPAFVLADALHSAYVAAALNAWADDAELAENGVIAGCEAYDLPATEDGVADTAILLVHGFNASPRHYDFIAPALAESGYDCHVMRLPGFAEPFALHGDHDSSDWTAAVAAELDALKSEHPRVGVVGHSLGGAVTIGALLKYPKAADFAVLLAPAIAVSDSRAPLLSTRSWHEVSQRLFLFTNVLRTPFPMDCHVEGRTDHPGRMPFSSPKIADALFTLMDDNLQRADELRISLTMIVCQDDPIVDTPAAERYFESIPAEDKQIIVLTNSGHEVPLDQEWKDVAALIAERAER